jgi:hypothetical protein
VPADITVRRADPAEADLVGELTERVYRGGGFGSGAYADVIRDTKPPPPQPGAATRRLNPPLMIAKALLPQGVLNPS